MSTLFIALETKDEDEDKETDMDTSDVKEEKEEQDEEEGKKEEKEEDKVTPFGEQLSKVKLMSCDVYFDGIKVATGTGATPTLAQVRL